MATVSTLAQGLTQDASTQTAGFFGNLRIWLNKQRSIRQTMRELSRLTDYELNDLGIARYDIPHIARQAAKSA